MPYPSARIAVIYRHMRCHMSTVERFSGKYLRECHLSPVVEVLPVTPFRRLSISPKCKDCSYSLRLVQTWPESAHYWVDSSWKWLNIPSFHSLSTIPISELLSANISSETMSYIRLRERKAGVELYSTGCVYFTRSHCTVSQSVGSIETGCQNLWCGKMANIDCC